MDKRPLDFSPSEDISLRDIFVAVLKLKNFIISNKWILILATLVVATYYGIDAHFKKEKELVIYVAKSTFSLEGISNLGSSPLDQNSLLSNFIGGGTKSSGGEENIYAILNTRTVRKKILLGSYKKDTKEYVLANLLVDTLKKLDSSRFKYLYKFEESIGQKKLLSRNEQSLLDTLSKQIIVRSSSLGTTNFTILHTEFPSENLAVILNERYLEALEDFSVHQKSKKTTRELGLLERRSDSLRNLLISSEAQIATINDRRQDVVFRRASLATNELQRKQSWLNASYIETNRLIDQIKANLKQSSQSALILERAETPLSFYVRSGKNEVKNEIKKGALIGFIFTLLLLLFIKLYRKTMSEG